MDDVCTERRQRRTYNGGGVVWAREIVWVVAVVVYSSVLVAIITIIDNQHPGTAAESSQDWGSVEAMAAKNWTVVERRRLDYKAESASFVPHLPDR